MYIQVHSGAFLFLLIQAGKHNSMVPVEVEDTKDTVSLICVVKPKPPSFTIA